MCHHTTLAPHRKNLHASNKTNSVCNMLSNQENATRSTPASAYKHRALSYKQPINKQKQRVLNCDPTSHLLTCLAAHNWQNFKKAKSPSVTQRSVSQENAFKRINTRHLFFAKLKAQ